MILSTGGISPELSGNPLLLCAAATMHASARSHNPHQRRRSTSDALAILDVAKHNATRGNDDPSLFTADTLASIAPGYSFKGEFAHHTDNHRYLDAFAQLYLEPAQQAVRRIGLQTMEVFARVDSLLNSTDAASPNGLALGARRKKIAEVMAYQAAVLGCLDPDEPEAFSGIHLPKFLKIK